MSFEAIISGAIPSYKIAENEAYLAFLEKTPLAMGHIVVIPKEKSESIFDMEDRALSSLHIFTKEVALKLKAAITLSAYRYGSDRLESGLCPYSFDSLADG